MTEQQFKEYSQMYTEQIESACIQLPLEEYSQVMESVTGLVNLVVDYMSEDL